MKTANLAIAFAELFGFSEKSTQQTLEQNERLLSVYKGLLTPLCQSFTGRIVKSIGEVVLVAFDSPTRAVLWAGALHDRLWQHNRSAAVAEQLTLRVGINVGEVRLEAQDVFGEPVNIAARVLGISEPNEVYFTEAVYLAMNKAEVPAEEVGAFELKGIPGKVRVFRMPKGLYRVTGTGSAGPESDQPPFGHLTTGQTGASPRVLPTVTSRQARMALAIGLALVVLGLIWAGARRSKVDAAIEAVASAPTSERSAKMDSARALIASEKDEGKAAFDLGRLHEAAQEPRRSVEDYRRSAEAGHSLARDRLVNLLRDSDCGTRAGAADAIGALRLSEARSRLEELARTGGPGDSDVRVLGLTVGCDSRRSAERALRHLE